MFYAVFDKATGRLVSSGSAVAAKLSADLVVKEFADKPRDDQVWDEATLGFKSAPRPTRLRKADFIQRFTLAERRELFGFAHGNTYTAAQQKNLAAFMRYLDFLDQIDLQDAAIVQGVGYLETVGILAAGRAAEVLA